MFYTTINLTLETSKLSPLHLPSPVKKEQQPKGNTFINLGVILAKNESLKIVLDS